MSRKVWLIRHAMPDLPIGERWCVGGRSDFPLGRLGRLQAALLPFVPELQGLDAVFCSSLIRARETALPLCPSPREMPGIQEQDMGVWDGLSFREIRQRFPALYAARELDPSLMPEGAESNETVRRRMTAGILRCLRESEGDIAIVSHKGAIAAILGSREGLDYTCGKRARAGSGDASRRRPAARHCPGPSGARCAGRSLASRAGLSGGGRLRPPAPRPGFHRAQ